jgi:hypothetical protein
MLSRIIGSPLLWTDCEPYFNPSISADSPFRTFLNYPLLNPVNALTQAFEFFNYTTTINPLNLSAYTNRVTFRTHTHVCPTILRGRFQRQARNLAR